MMKCLVMSSVGEEEKKVEGKNNMFNRFFLVRTADNEKIYAEIRDREHDDRVVIDIRRHTYSSYYPYSIFEIELIDKMVAFLNKESEVKDAGSEF